MLLSRSALCAPSVAVVKSNRNFAHSCRLSSSGSSSSPSSSMELRKPVLLFDVMGTIVRDPFFTDVPAFFGLTMKELLEVKHPTSWIEFEKGTIDEEELKLKFFNDGREFDFEGLKACMVDGYEFIEGMEELLERLKAGGYEMHAFSNYPSWYRMIDDKLCLSRYLSWSFVSCHTGKRKPAAEAYEDVVRRLQVDPSTCSFIDDQSRNVQAAQEYGMVGVSFVSAPKLKGDLVALGLTCLED